MVAGAKVVRKNSPDERVGALCLEDGRPSIVEYYELTNEMKEAKNADGSPAYDFGVILNYIFKTQELEDVMDRLNTKYWFSSMQKGGEQEYTEMIETLISKAPMPVKAVLGKSTISVNDFINLQVGDIIRLDTKIEEELNVYVGSIKKFTALPGASGDQYAVRVTSVIREEQ